MPKIIDAVKEKAIRAAREEIAEQGYEKLTMRGIAARISVSVGTLYHYFPSKEALSAELILEDWLPLRDELKKKVLSCHSGEEVCALLYEKLLGFSLSHQAVFATEKAHAEAGKEEGSFHARLVMELAGWIAGKMDIDPDGAFSTAAAELILLGVRQKKDYASLRLALERLTGGNRES